MTASLKAARCTRVVSTLKIENNMTPQRGIGIAEGLSPSLLGPQRPE